MWSSSLTDSTAKGMPDIEAVDISSIKYCQSNLRSNYQTNDI